MVKHKNASCREANNPVLRNMVVSSIDLSPLPGVRAHFAHIRGASTTDKVMLDPGLLDRADGLVSAYEALAATSDPFALDQLRQIGLTRSEVVRMRHVVDHPELWNRSQVDEDEL